MPLNLNAYLGIQPDALRVYSQRAEVLAANLANEDTPGYQARDIDFRPALAAAHAFRAALVRNGVSVLRSARVGPLGEDAVEPAEPPKPQEDPARPRKD